MYWILSKSNLANPNDQYPYLHCQMQQSNFVFLLHFFKAIMGHIILSLNMHWPIYCRFCLIMSKCMLLTLFPRGFLIWTKLLVGGLFVTPYVFVYWPPLKWIFLVFFLLNPRVYLGKVFFSSFSIVRQTSAQCRTPTPRGMASQHIRTFERVPVNKELLTGSVLVNKLFIIL